MDATIPWEIRMCSAGIYNHQRLTMAMTAVCDQFEDFGISVAWGDVT